MIFDDLMIFNGFKTYKFLTMDPAYSEFLRTCTLAYESNLFGTLTNKSFSMILLNILLSELYVFISWSVIHVRCFIASWSFVKRCLKLS